MDAKKPFDARDNYIAELHRQLTALRADAKRLWEPETVCIVAGAMLVLGAIIGTVL